MSVDRLERIRSQVEFYFCDANFRVDKFLKQQAMLNNGYIPIETIISFKRLRDLRATVDDVKETMKDNNMVELKDENIKKIETEEYLSYVLNKDIIKRVIHIDGFDPDCTLEDIKEILSGHITPVLIRMRRDKSKTFSGSAFVELISEEEAVKALGEKIPVKSSDENEKIKKQKNEERYLVIMSKEDYLNEKEKRSAERKEKEAREALERDFVPRLFRYESNEDLDIGMIRKMVKNSAFVDIEKNVIRMRNAEEGEVKKYESDGKEITLTKMNEDDAIEYCKTIKISPKEVKSKRK